jgi:hypothetical protein
MSAESRQARQLPRRGQSIAGFHQPVGQPHAQGLLPRDAAPSQDQVQRLALPDQARQPDGAQIDQRHPKAPAVDSQRGIPRHDAQVAPQRQFQAARYRVPFDGGDRRLRK